MQGSTCRGQMAGQMENDPANRVDPWVSLASAVGMFTAGAAELSADGLMYCDVFGEEGMTMVTGLQLGEHTAPDPQRPSLILRRSGDAELWDIAKECGSTVDAICKANGLAGQPEEDIMLLIPVI